MNNSDASQKNEISQKDRQICERSEQMDPPSSEKFQDINKFKNILLDLNEKPDIIIEKILIDVFNRYISPENNETEYLELDYEQKKITKLCKKYEKFQIVFYLLTKIRSLIKKYREKILELPNIIELQEKFFIRYYEKSYSPIRKVSKHYIRFWVDPHENHWSYPKFKKNIDYYYTIKNLFCELKNIKNCLEKSAPIIEKIFEVPLSEFDKFSIYECEKEDYLKILIHDSFIWNEIIKNKKTSFERIIKEITEDNNKSLTLMTAKIEEFKKLYEYSIINIDEMLKISKAGSSADTRFPEDSKPMAEINYSYRIKEYYDSLTSEINYFPSNEEADLEESTNIEAQYLHSNDNISNIEDEIFINTIKETIVEKNSKEKNILKNNKININTISIKESAKYNILKAKIENKKIKGSPVKNISANNYKFHAEMNAKTKNNKKYQNNKEKIFKNNKEKKNINENNNNNKYGKNNKKIDKKEIPSDIDDLVKYIVNDDKTQTQNKKKKKNKKKNKKNKNEIKNEKDDEAGGADQDLEDKKEQEDSELRKIKENFVENSINKYNIYKIKFKFKSKWLDKISKYN